MIKNTLFVKIFSGFLITIVLFSTVLLISYNIGLNNAVDNWSQNSQAQIEVIAIKILLDDFQNIQIPQDIPIFVYNFKKEIIYSNRGAGRKKHEEKDFIPVYKDRYIIGYFVSSKVHFLDSEANKQFAHAITIALVIALLISTILIIFIALFVSGSISRPAKNIALFLQNLTKGKHGVILKTKGTIEIQQITDAVNNLSTELAREEELRSQWTRDIAHDLRTPVAALKAQFEGMSRGALEINIHRVNQNLKEVLRMEYLVEDLSEIMKLEDTQTSIYIDEIKASNFISQIKYLSLNEIKKKNIKSVFRSSIDTFIADEMLLYRAISNIWVNAVRHTEVGGNIFFDIKQSNKKTTITINNSGEVIPENEISKIFDRLFRGEKARNSEGSGLGLTITKKVVDLHGGTVKVLSDLKHGTTFTIGLPN